MPDVPGNTESKQREKVQITERKVREGRHTKGFPAKGRAPTTPARGDGQKLKTSKGKIDED